MPSIGQTPYTEEFVIPYPPLAYWTTCAPRMFDDRRITSNQDPQIGPIYFDYNRGFRGLMFLCDLASFVILLLIACKRRPQMARLGRADLYNYDVHIGPRALRPARRGAAHAADVGTLLLDAVLPLRVRDLNRSVSEFCLGHIGLRDFRAGH